MDPARARELLEAERKRLQAMAYPSQQSDFGQAEQERSSELLQPEPHPSDAAQELYEQEQEQSFAEHAQAELGEIDHALRKLDEGTYGLDEETGEPIPDERLEALPATRYNVDTKRIDEKRAGISEAAGVNERAEGDPTATAGGGRVAR